MKSLQEIKRKYSFLLENAFVIDQEFSANMVDSILYRQIDDPKMLLSLMIERGILSVSVSTEYILNSKAFGKYNKYYEIFYIIKLLNPAIKFENIESTAYPLFLKENLEKIKSLFNNSNVGKTVSSLDKIISDYDKIRWEK